MASKQVAARRKALKKQIKQLKSELRELKSKAAADKKKKSAAKKASAKTKKPKTNAPVATRAAKKPSSPIVQKPAIAPLIAAERSSPATARETMLSSIKISGP
jgi:hypothetical protein